MTTLRLPPTLYLRELRVLGAWWRVGSSVIDPLLLVERATLRRSDPAAAADTLTARKD